MWVSSGCCHLVSYQDTLHSFKCIELQNNELIGYYLLLSLAVSCNKFLFRSLKLFTLPFFFFFYLL